MLRAYGYLAYAGVEWFHQRRKQELKQWLATHTLETLKARLNDVRPDLSFLAGGLHLPWVTMVFLTGFIIEAMLAGRLWLQLNNEDADATGLKATTDLRHRLPRLAHSRVMNRRY